MGARGGLRDLHIEKTVLVRGLRLGEIVTGWYLDHALERTVIDLDDKKFAFAGAGAVRPLPADHEAVTIDGQFEVLPVHARQLDFDYQSAVCDVDVGVGDPVSLTSARGPVHGFAKRVQRRVNFAHG